MKLAVIGSSEFIVGFQLAGITKTFEAGNNPLDDIRNMKKDKEIGIIVIEESALDKMDVHDRISIEDSVDPVFIPISKEATQGTLRRLIKRSIGVDLWKGD